VDPAIRGLIGLAILLIIDGFFSAARTALGNVRRQSLRDLADKGDTRASRALAVAEDSIKVISTFRLANLLTHFVTGAVVTALLLPPLAAWVDSWLPLSSVVTVTLVYVVSIPLAALATFLLSESLPESMVQRDPARWAMALAAPARVTIALFAPLVAVIAGGRRLLAGAVDSTALVTEEEIMTLVDAGQEEGSIEQNEKEMIYSVFQLGETLAREIMVPRIDIVALEIATPLEEAREVIIKAGHSRIPVYGESLDHVEGLLYAKDLLEVWHAGKDSFDMRALLRPAQFVPESKHVSDLLRELQSAKVHMAIVIDEYGGTAGLVTIEDIIEEIFGEILDEYDEAEEAVVETVGDGEFIFDARISLDDFNHLLDVELSDDLGDTLGGYIYGQLGKVPEAGEIVDTGRLHMEVLSVDDRRIRKVRVVQLAPEETPAQPEESNGKANNAQNGTDH
jgi:putative hemolysin